MDNPRVGWVYVGAVGCAMAGFGAVKAPALTVAALALAYFGYWAVLHPYKAACTLAFLTAAFPKAGVKVGGFPFPVFLFGLLIAAVLLRMTHTAERRRPGTVLVLLVLACWLFVRLTVYAEYGMATVAAFAAWTVVPIVLLVLVSGLKDVPISFRRSIEWGFLVSVTYAVLQLATSVESVAIPGLTYAFGDDLTQKNNMIFGVAVEDFSKIPSTYHNGNIYGLVAAVMLIVAVRRPLEKRGTGLDLVVALGAGFAIAVSGSRTAMVAAVVAFVILMLGRGTIGQKVGAIFALCTVAGVAVVTQPGLVERYSVDNLGASGGAGRADAWRATMDRLTTSNWVLGTRDPVPTEGWPGLVMQLGLVGIVLLALAYWVLAAHRREWWPVAVVLVVGAFIDSAYLLFPTWFLPAALLAVSDRPIEAATDPPAGSGRLAESRVVDLQGRRLSDDRPA